MAAELRLFDRIIATVLVLCVAGTLLLQHQQNELRASSSSEARAWRECMGDQFTDLAEALKARGDATKAKDEGVTNVFKAAALPGTRAEVRAALRIAITDYLAAQEDVTQVRTEHPYPDYPKGVCG